MKRLLLVTLLIAAMVLSACSGQPDQTEASGSAPEAAQTQTEENSNTEAKASEAESAETYQAQTYTYDIYGETYEVTYTEPPMRAVTMSQFMTEMLLALDLGDRMVGTAFMDNEIYPDYKDAYEQIEILSDKYPSKEVMYAVQPDFVSGWTSVFNEKRVASASEMMESGIHPFLAQSIGAEGSMESVYEDFMTLGKIFAVEDKAKEVVEKLQAEVAEIQAQLGEISSEEQVKVFAYDSGDNEPFVVAGGGVSGDLIRKAGGINIFDDVKKGYATVSWEEVVAQSPDVIVVVDYGDTTVDAKIDMLKNHPALQDLKAIQEDKFIVVGLADLSPGVRNTGALKLLAQGFYPEKFN